MNRHNHNHLVVKAVISMGFFALLILPEGWKEWAALSLNFLWLWRT